MQIILHVDDAASETIITELPITHFFEGEGAYIDVYSLRWKESRSRMTTPIASILGRIRPVNRKLSSGHGGC
jgi:hypothetical protein